MMATLSMADYRRKVYGCWLGKSIGGTLGGPHEGKMQVLNLEFYDPVPAGAIPNDDLDLQLVWLAALRAHGPAVDERVLGEWWLRSLQYPFDEYGIAMWNLARGIEPPISGQFANHFSHCMGAPIRSEIWACVAPGCPGVAASYAYCDGCVDHGGEGIYGEMFFAALESAAFVISDRDALLDLGLEMIPADCRTAGAVRLTRELHAAGLDWLAARERILERYGDVNFTDAPQNIAFTVLGWLWGENAADGMCKAVNCGYDTDCTGATLGSILGLLHGPEVFESRWVEPVGDEVVVGWGVHDCEVPRTLQELTDWTLELTNTVLEANDAPLRIGDTTDLQGLRIDASQPAELSRRLERHHWTLRRKVATGAGEATLWLGLNGPPALAPGEARAIELEVDGSGPIALRVPGGWRAERVGDSNRFTVTAPAGVGQAPSHRLVALVGEEPASCPFALVPACGWAVAGPVPVDDLVAALEAPPELGESRSVWTADHRLVLDDGLPQDRVYRIVTKLAVSEPKQVRLVSATPGLQRVRLDGELVLSKNEPTRFVPAPHRSGPGTATEPTPWLAGERTVEILLGARAGQPAELHLFVTRSREVDGPKLVPWADLTHRMP